LAEVGFMTFGDCPSKTRFSGSAVTVAVSGAKSESRLAAQMDNPFRDWVDDSEALGQAACDAYARASRAVGAVALEAPDRLDAVERALRAFVADLNAINGESGLIDTNYRAQAWDVFSDLAALLHIPISGRQVVRRRPATLNGSPGQG
jgi:hypothetical protein